MFDDADVIHAYTRADAIADGFLVDVTTVAREAGFRYPVAMTRPAWTQTVEWTDAIEKRSKALQDESGRLWDVIFMAAYAVRAAAKRGVERDTFLFSVHCVPPTDGSLEPVKTQLRLTLDGGDDGNGAYLISLPNEDL